MATCKKCGNTYYAKKCYFCEKKSWENKINQNNKINHNDYKNYKKINKHEKKETDKIIKISTIIIAICTILFTSSYFYDRYQTNKLASQYLKILYGTDNQDEIIKKINQMNETDKETFKTAKKEMEKINKDYIKMMKKINNR